MTPLFPTRGVIHQTDLKGLLETKEYSAGLVVLLEYRLNNLTMKLPLVSIIGVYSLLLACDTMLLNLIQLQPSSALAHPIVVDELYAHASGRRTMIIVGLRMDMEYPVLLVHQ